MATVTERPRTRNLTESHQRVRDPLRRLRGYILRYVISESLLVLVTLLAVCFWVGMLIDYGMFRLFGIDFVNDLPRAFRALMLGLGLLAVFFFAEGIKALRTQPRPEVVGDRGRESLVVKVFSHPWLLAAVAAPILMVYIAGWIWLASLVDAEALSNLAVGLFVLAFVIGFITFVVVKRLVYEFRPAALALVLERRFPDLLEDRLITAVELSDAKRAAEYGYSQAMVEETIHQAGVLVDRIHLGEVFRWARLVWWGAAAALLTVGAYALAGGGAMVVDALNKEKVSAGTSFTELNDVSAIWFERNVLLDDEPWPGGVMIVRPVGVLIKERKGKKREVLDRFVLFPDSGEVKVGKGGEATIQAIAYEFALYDRNIKGRWRPVTLDDLRNGALDVGEVPAAEDLPPNWVPINKDFGLAIEDARYYSAKWQPADESGQKAQAQITRAIKKLGELADDPDSARKFRRLRQPKKVSVYTEQGDKETFEEMEQRAGKVYEHKISKLASTIDFSIRADDSVSRPLRLIMVPPPRMAEIYCELSVPAYLYHLPRVRGAGITMPSLAAEVLGQAVATPLTGPLAAAALLPPERAYDDDQRFLIPRKQRLLDFSINVGGVSRPEVPVPAGSDLVLRARCDKPLSTARADDVVVWRSDTEKEERPQMIDEYSFRFTLSNVRQATDLQFEFTDTDGDSGKQVLVVTPNADETPQIKQFQPDVVRLVEDKYIVTPTAIIPFKIVASDDHGLSSVEYAYSVQEAATQSHEIRRAATVASSIGMSLRGPDAPLSSLAHAFYLPASLTRSEETITGMQPLAHFKAEFDKKRIRTIEKIKELLDTPLPKEEAAESIRNYLIKDLREFDAYLNDPDAEIERSKPFKGFNVGDIRRREGALLLPLAAPEGQLQKNYLMLVALEVRDTNVHRPGRGHRVSSQQYPFLIVSDTELLFQISLEEQRLFDELKKTFDDLEKARGQLSALRFDIPAEPGARGVDFVGFSVRAEEIDKTVREALRVTTKVHSDYDRILREMRTNRIHEGSKRQIVERVKENIVVPLGKVKEGDFPYAQAACTTLRRTLDNTALADLNRLARSRTDAEAAEKELDRVTNALREVLVHMANIVEIGKLIATIRKLEQSELESLDAIKRAIKRLEDDLFQQLEPKKDEKKEDKKEK